MNVQSCFMSTFISINIARFFRPANPQNAKIVISIKLCKKWKYCLFTCLIHRILYISNQFAKRNETFIIRLIPVALPVKTSPDYVVNFICKTLKTAKSLTTQPLPLSHICLITKIGEHVCIDGTFFFEFLTGFLRSTKYK